MKTTLYGLTYRSHGWSFVVFALIFALFVTLAAISAVFFSLEAHQWALAAFLTLTAGLTAAWELRVMFLMRRNISHRPPAR